MQHSGKWRGHHRLLELPVYFPTATSIHHYFHVNGRIFPYAGLAPGATYAEMKLYYNTYVSSDYNRGFLIRPEPVAIVKFSDISPVGLIIGARYTYSTTRNPNLR
jgi:hypothetical protein